MVEFRIYDGKGDGVINVDLGLTVARDLDLHGAVYLNLVKIDVIGVRNASAVVFRLTGQFII